MTPAPPLQLVQPLSPAAPGPAALWFGILAGPAAWTMQGLLAWFFGQRICASMSIGGVRATLAAVSVGALAVAGAGAATGWRNLRRANPGGQTVEVDPSDRVHFMALAGLLVSVVFIIGIFWAALPSVLLRQCGYVR